MNFSPRSVQRTVFVHKSVSKSATSIWRPLPPLVHPPPWKSLKNSRFQRFLPKFEDSLLTETKGGTVAGIRHAMPRSFSHP